jgi:hypothetical protein
MKTLSRIPVLALAALAALALAACSSAPAIPVVEITTDDYAFVAPTSITGGLLQVNLTNAGEEEHHIQFVRLSDGVSMEQLGAALQSGDEAAIFALVTFEGGPSVVPAGGHSSATMDLPTGNYALMCFVQSPVDGLPHLAKGMVTPITVTAADEKPAAPEADVTVHLRDFAFTGVPATVEAGEQVWEVVNDGPEPHEMSLIKLTGISKADFGAALSAMFSGEAPAGPPPFESAGGFQALMAGGQGWANLNLEPGDYALVCFVPSGANAGAPHAALGMVATFTAE